MDIQGSRQNNAKYKKIYFCNFVDKIYTIGFNI